MRIALKLWPKRERSWFSLIEMVLTVVIVVLIWIELKSGTEQLTALRTLNSSITQEKSQQIAALKVLNTSVTQEMQDEQTAFQSMNGILTHSLQVSEHAAKIANQNAEQSLRAYIGIVLVSSVVQTGKKISVVLRAQNSGRTPAINCKFRSVTVAASSVEEAHNKLVKEKFYDPHANVLGEFESRVVLVPGEGVTETLAGSTPLTSQQYSALTGHLITEYAFAYSWYTDSFGKLRHTSACYFYQPQLKTFAICDKFNSFSGALGP